MENWLIGVYEVIYDINELFGIIGGVIGLLADFIFFFLSILLGHLTKNKTVRNAGMVVVILLFVATLGYLFASAYVDDNYTRVPNMIDNDYREAKNSISNAGLICDELRYGVDDYRVVKQSPAEDAFVEKGSGVSLTLEEGNDIKGLSNIQEAYADHGQVDVIVEVRELLGDVDGAKISRDLTDLDSIVVYLYEPKLDIYIREYIVDGNCIHFEGIPEKVNYNLFVYLDGYELYEETAYVSEERVNEEYDACVFNAYMPMESAVTCSKSIQIVNNSEYDFDDLLVRFEFDGLKYIGDQFYVGSHGTVDCELHYYESLEMTVIVSSELGGGSETGSCQVELETYDTGYVSEEIRIRLNADGSCQVE